MPKILIKRGTSTQWTNSTTALSAGELGLDTTNNILKVGNGTDLWSSLSGLILTSTQVNELAQDAIGSALNHSDHSNIVVNYNDSANKITLSSGPDLVTFSDLGNSLGDYIPLSYYGNEDGVATLDSNGFIPDAQIPSTIARDSELFSGSYNDLSNKPSLFSGSYDDLSNKPTIPSLTGYATETYVGNAISNLVDSAPSTLNTLNELAAALGDDANYATTISTALGNKLDSSTASSTYLTQTDASSTYLTQSLASTGYVAVAQPAIDYYITNSGSGAYVVNGVDNGPVEFIKGKKYRIHVAATGHPFWIQTTSGAYSSGNVYSTGIIGNGTQSGHIIVELPQNAPDNLYYACEFHSSMAGAVLVRTDNISFNQQSSNYTLTTSDSGRLIEMSGGGTLTITDSSSFPVGFTCDILQTTTSQVTITGTSFTPDATPGLKLRTRWSSATLIKRALNSWVVLGDLSA